MPKLFRAMYYSRSLIIEAELRGQLEQIVAAAKRNNARNEVTGSLLYSRGYFAQVLEGALHDVETTLARIERDTRHEYFQLLELGPVGERLFVKWSMVLAGQPAIDDPQAAHALAQAVSKSSGGGNALAAYLFNAVLA